MAELYQQLAFITAILGGFTITYLSVLLFAPATRIVDWTINITTSAAVCFILSALGSTFSAVVAGGVGSSAVQEEVKGLHEPLSLLLLAGTILLLAALGMSGWMRSRKSGISTTVISTVALIGGYFIMRSFIF